MQSLEMKPEAFRTWLRAHAQEVVGHPGMCFHSPLARWLSEQSGHVYGVDGRLYGRALWEAESWVPLPSWAERFTTRLERLFCEEITGHEAGVVLYTLTQA